MSSRSALSWIVYAGAFACAAAFSLSAEAEEPAKLLAGAAADGSGAPYTAILTLFTGLLVAVSAIQIAFLRQADETAKASAKTAREAADLARQSLIAGQRAWIRIDEVALGRGVFAFEQDRASAALSFKISNVGNAPATKITVNARLVAAKDGAAALAQRRAMCDAIRRAPFDEGFTLFPGEGYPSSIGYSGWTRLVSIGRDEIEEGRAESLDGQGVPLFVIGCVDYAFPADEGAHHQTGFLLELRRHNGFLINPEEKSIAIGQLALMEDSTGAGRYAD